MRHTTTAIVLLAAAGSAAHADLFDWNLVVRNNLNITSEVDGSALIGGNVNGTSNYAVQTVSNPNGVGLAVGGDIAAGTNVQVNNGGNLAYAGNIFGNANLNGGGSSYYQPAVSNMVGDAFTQANSLSAYLAALSSTGSVDGAGNMNASTTTIGSEEVAVYSMSQSTIAGLGQLNLNFGSADVVVINFDASGSGGNASFAAPPNFVGGLNQANSSRIIWNFVNTTSLTVNNNFNGSILAMDADLALLGGGINGSVIVDSVSAMNAEVRLNTFQGALPTPGAASLLALGGIFAARRRR